MVIQPTAVNSTYEAEAIIGHGSMRVTSLWRMLGELISLVLTAGMRLVARDWPRGRPCMTLAKGSKTSFRWA